MPRTPADLPAGPISHWASRQLETLATLSPSQLRGFSGTHRMVDTGSSLLTVPHIRQVLYGLNDLLAKGGELIVHCANTSDQTFPGRRIGTQIQYHLGTIFPNCYHLCSRTVDRLIFRKAAEGRAWMSELRDVSVGFVSDGREIVQIRRNLDVLSALRSKLNCEVLLAGPEKALAALAEGRPWVHLVGDCVHEDVRAPINRKKGQIIDQANMENVVIAHDRFLLDETFWSQLIGFGNDFDFYNCRHCALSDLPIERRVQGDYGFHTDPIGGFSYNAKSGSREYGESNPFFYNNGGLYIGKRKWFLDGRWPRHLHWSDLEDVHFTRRCELDGAVWRHDWLNRVYTTNRRMGYLPSLSAFRRLRSRLRDALLWLQFRRQQPFDTID